MTPLGSAALELAAKGLRVFPCVERGKEPAFRDNLKRATIDPNIIAGWWRRKSFNVAIATGVESGIWVLDIDGAEGEALLRQLEAEHSCLPPTVEAITGDPDKSRGASATVDAARLVHTLAPMNPDEAQTFNIPEEEHRSYVRYDRAKLNVARTAGGARWFKLVGVPIGLRARPRGLLSASGPNRRHGSPRRGDHLQDCHQTENTHVIFPNLPKLRDGAQRRISDFSQPCNAAAVQA